MRGQCQAGLRKGWGRRWLVLVKGWSSSCLSIDGHSAAPGHQEAPLCKAWCASISTGIHILGLPNVSWIFGPQVHPLECRMLNLPLSLHSSDLHSRVTCIVLEAQLFHWLARGLYCHEDAIHRLLWKWESKWADVGGWLAGICGRDCITGSWQRSDDAELCVGQRHAVLWIGSR